ncbi:MAG: GGDEF domain-containing protein, partial [Desulfovibrionaceae bacterium]|nr:GGDEF domain-containing protein [Desulfovibrionaceae bacterium]
HTTFQCPKGTRQALYWSKGIVAAGTGQIGRMGVIVDITKEWRLKRKLAQKVAELQRVKRILQEMSRTDALTGLSNRRPFNEFLEKCVAMAHRRGYPSCLLMLDLDHFKRINDTFGHGEGDTVLRACADTLREVSRREDLPARIGGEEFAVLLPSTELAEARVMAERIRCAIGERILLPDGQRVTASLGAAQYHIEESAEDFVRRTDEALYRAKHSGRNQVCS